MKSPLEDTIWGASYGSVTAVQEAFDRIGPEYHDAILASGAPSGAAVALMKHVRSSARGIDFGCGSGALGVALEYAGLATPLDGLDLSPGMLELARRTCCYRKLVQVNLLVPERVVLPDAPYDFAISMGLVGDYVPFYIALPMMAASVRVGGFIGYAVERRSTPAFALERLVRELELKPVSETMLPVPEGTLTEQVYHFFVVRK